MTAEDFLNQYDTSNKNIVSQKPAPSTGSFLDQYDPSINKNLEPESSGILRQAADIPVKFAQGAVGSVKNFTDLLGADNPASKELAGYEKWIGSLVSAESKKDDQEIARIFKDAENKGVYDKVIAGLEAFSKAPLEMAAQSAGYMVPQLAAGALGKAAQLGRAGILGAQLATGFAQGVGTIKGDIYDATKDYLREKGVPEDKIESIASKAQAYNGGNLDQMLIGGGLMAADALGGAEAILTRVLTKQGKAASGGIIKGILKGGLEEALIEIPQEGQEQVASNLALQRLGYDVSTFKGVPERAAMAGAAGFAMGGALGGIEALSPEQKEQKDIDKEAERRARDLESTDPATQAVSTEITRLERGIDNKRQDLDALESNSPEASKLRLDIAEDQKNLAVLKEQANKLGLSVSLTEAEKQQIALANLIAAEPNPAKLLAMPSIAEQEAGIAYGGEPGLYDVFGSITRKPVSIPKPAELPAAPTIEEQTAEGTYGGQTGVFDVFAGARRKPVEVAPTIAKSAPVEPITPAPVTEQPIEAKPQRYVLQQIGATSGEWRTIQILPNKEAADAEQAKLPEGATGWRIIPETPVTEQAAPAEAPAPEVAPAISDSTKRTEAIAIESVNTPQKLTRRLQDALDTYGIKNRKSWTLDFENKQLVSPDKTTAIKWTTRNFPNEPESYRNQQTNLGKATLVKYQPAPAVSETITEPVQRDVTKPEQMTPEEFAQFEEDYDKQARVQSAKKAKAQILSESGLAKIAEDNDILRIEGQSEWYSFQVSGKRIKKYRVTENGARGTGFYSAPKGGSNLTLSQLKQWLLDRVSQNAQMGTYTPFDSETAQGDAIYQALEARRPISSEAYESLESYQKPNLPEGYVKQGELYVYQPATGKPKLGEREKADTDFASVDEITEIFHESAPAGTDKSESKRIAVNFVKDYINQSIDWVRDTFGSAPDKVGFNATEMKKWLKEAISVRRVSDDEFTKGIIQKKGSLKQNGEVNISILSPLESRLIALHESSHFLYHLGDTKSIPENVLNSIRNKKLMPDRFPNPSKDIKEKFADAFTNWAFTKMHPEYASEFPSVPQEFVSWIESEAINEPLDYISSVNKIRKQKQAKPKLGEKGGVLIPTKEDFIQAGQNIYEAGMEFGAWAKQMIQRFGDAVREFLGEVWQAVSGAPAKLNELMGYLPKNGEAGAVNIGGGKIGGKTEAVTEPAPSGERQQIMGEKIGPLKKTPAGIIAETQAKLRERFDPTKVTEQNTTEAFRALGKLTGKDGTAFAQELNDIGRMVDESGAAAEVSMGAALFVNDLFEYSVKLAAQGQKKMLGIMMTNINKLPTGTEGRSDAGRALRAAREMKNTFLNMAKAEQDAFINYAAEFVYGPNPTKEQINSIQIGYDAVEQVQEPTAKEVEEEIAAVGEKTGTDLVGKINEEFTKATEKSQAKRKTEIEELDKEYKKIQNQADAEIEKLAKIQSDTPSFDLIAARQTVNDVRAIVANDLKQRPDMGRKAPWKSMLVAKLQEAGVEVAAAETLADIVWRQHEINNLSRELSSINKAIENGPISEIIKAIKETPLEEQQNPNWRYEVMRDYLRKAGLPLAQAERIAKLMDISLQKRFTMAQEQAFTDAISKTAPWKSGDTRSRRVFQKVLQALRAGALDPARNVLSDMAALNGWTGFTPEQYKTLLKNDAILADPKAGDLKKTEAYKAIQDVISKAKLPIRARNVIGQYYDAQALSGIPTFSVNAFSPIAFAMRNLIVEIGSGTLKGNPKAITNATTAFVDSIKSWANTVSFSFKNNVTVYSNVDYIVNDDNLLRLYRKGVDQFTKSKNAKERADGIKNMMIGMMDYVRRMLNALDYGTIAGLQNQNISKYSMEVMKRQGMSTKEANEMFGVMMKAKNDFYVQQIADGTDKNRASILADEFYISSWSEALSKAGVEKSDIKQAMDAAINDALSSVGRNRQSIDALKGEATKLKDAGVSSMPALWLLESMANAANQSENQVLKLFSRVIYGFAIVPARVIRDTAWFSPYGFVRFGYDYAAKKMGKTSPYAQSLGNDIQYSQRLNEAIAGTVALTALFALRAGSTDDPDDKDVFKIVFTGNGPQRKDDPQFYDSWYKKGNKPNTMSVYFGKTKFTLNMMRGFEAFTWPAMMLGALDDLEIRKKQKKKSNSATQFEDAAIVAGFVFDAALRRGPYAFTTKSLFGQYGDIGVEGVAKGLTFPGKTLIPILGTSLASNISNFLNEPIDRRTLDGAMWSNIPFIGPAVAPKSLNAFGEPALSNDMASKMFKLGVPIVYDIPTDRESIKLHELVLKQGGGPSIPTRNQLAQRLDRQPTNKEYEMFVREYGSLISADMKLKYDKLFEASPELYSKYVEKIGLVARDISEAKVRQSAKKP